MAIVELLQKLLPLITTMNKDEMLTIDKHVMDMQKQKIAELEVQLANLRRLATEYVEAESAYHKAHKKGEAGPGVCLRANNACAKLSAALPEIEDEVAPLTDEERARLRQIMNEQDAKREK